MRKTYLDKLCDSYHQSNIWQRIAMGSGAVNIVQAVASVFLVSTLMGNIDRIRYILAPGVSALTTVRPGEMPESYIEQAFVYATDQLNGWTYLSVKDNYKKLFQHFYGPDLVTKTQANLIASNFFDEVDQRKLISFWQYIPDESKFDWCGKVSLSKEIKGVACGIVTGVQRLYAHHNVSVSDEKISYLVYAVNVAPTNNNFFAIKIMRVKRGPLKALQEELDRALKDGTLSNEVDNASY